MNNRTMTISEQLGHYERCTAEQPEPLVKGGQGRTAKEVKDSAMFLSLLFVGVALLVFVLGYPLLAAVVAVLVIVVTTVGLIAGARKIVDEPEAVHIDVHG